VVLLGFVLLLVVAMNSGYIGLMILLVHKAQSLSEILKFEPVLGLELELVLALVLGFEIVLVAMNSGYIGLAVLAMNSDCSCYISNQT
jgi:hypothetical protein